MKKIVVAMIVYYQPYFYVAGILKIKKTKIINSLLLCIVRQYNYKAIYERIFLLHGKTFLRRICILQYNEGTWNFQATQIMGLR